MSYGIAIWRKVVLIATVVAFTSVRAVPAAQGVTVKASVSPTAVTVGDSLTYSIEVSGAAGGITKSDPPDFASLGFRQIGESSWGQNIVIAGGQTRVSQTAQWRLQAARDGQIEIPPARITLAAGQTFASNGVRVTVSKAPTLPGPADFQNEEIYPAKTGQESLDRQLRGKVFLRASADRTEAYVGEQITLRYEIYQAFDPGQLSYSRPQPDYSGFMHEVIDRPEALKFHQRAAGGVTYNVATVEAVALFAPKAGQITISPLRMQVGIPVERSRRDPFSVFDDPFFDFGFPSLLDRRIPAVLMARAIAINILPLPEPGRPVDFNGTVGEFELSASFDRQQVEQYEIVNLRVEFSGAGQVRMIGEPRLPEVPGLARFKQRSEDGSSLDGERVRGRKIFEYSLRPTKAGQIEFPSIDYWIFNPARKQYQRLQTAPMALQVRPAPEASAPVVASFTAPPAANGSAASPVEQINRDIEYIRTTGFLQQGLGAAPLYQHTWFLLLQLVPAAMVATSYAVRRRRAKLEGDVALARRRIARGVASKRLRGARKLLLASQADQFFEELDRALRRFIADQLNESAAGLTGDRIAQALETRGVSQETIDEVAALLELCQTARYASVRPGETEMGQALLRASSLIDQLSRSLR